MFTASLDAYILLDYEPNESGMKTCSQSNLGTIVILGRT